MKRADFLAAGLCALALLPAAALAGEASPAKPGEKIERRVVVRPGAEPQVMTWTSEDGDGGEGLPRKFKFAGPLGRGYLGVQLTELTPELRQHFGAPEDTGVLFGHVEDGSPADKAGLRVGDILIQVDGEPVESSWDVTAAVRPKKDGESVGLEIVRGGRSQTLNATLAERERGEVDVMPMVLRQGKPGEGPESFEVALPALAPAMKRLEVILDSPEMKERMERTRVRNEELEKKLQDMEKRLAELEKRLKDNSK
jgi:membrane-associated protease RseP (regulator of RpoE activity)